MLTCTFNSEAFEAKLKLFGSGLGLIFLELLKDVGEKMTAEVTPPRRTGRLAASVRFLANHYEPSALTTRKNLSRGHVRYANPVEHGSTVKSRGIKKTGEYVNKRGTKVVFDKTNRLFFKIDGEWMSLGKSNEEGYVETGKTKPREAQPFMKPVFDRYFGGDGSLGYRELANALQERMAREVGQ